MPRGFRVLVGSSPPLASTEGASLLGRQFLVICNSCFLHNVENSYVWGLSRALRSIETFDIDRDLYAITHGIRGSFGAVAKEIDWMISQIQPEDSTYFGSPDAVPNDQE